MRSFLTKRADPHSVYRRVLPMVRGLESARIVPRALHHLTSRFRFVRLLLLIAGDLGAAFACLRLSERPLVVREFSGWTWIFLGAIVKLLSPRARVFLNVNHNLNNEIEARFVLPALSKLHKICFIEPSSSCLNEHPWLTPLFLSRPQLPRPVGFDRLFVFCGQRAEQQLLRADQLERLLRLLPKQLDVYVSGGGARKPLSPEVFTLAFEPGSAIVLLYDLSLIHI
jgi:hypothetical protein